MLMQVGTAVQRRFSSQAQGFVTNEMLILLPIISFKSAPSTTSRAKPICLRKQSLPLPGVALRRLLGVIPRGAVRDVAFIDSLSRIPHGAINDALVSKNLRVACFLKA